MYSVLLPTYNECENLPIIVFLLVEMFEKQYFQLVIRSNIEFEIIVIDDSSPDGTFKVAEKLQALYGPDRIILKSRKGKLGLGNLSFYLRVGLCFWALRLQGRVYNHHGCRSFPPCRIIIITYTAFGDSSNDRRAKEGKLRHRYRNEVQVDSNLRYSYGGSIQGWPWIRILTSCTANLLAITLLNPGHGLTDLTGSFRLYRTEILRTLVASCTSVGYAFQMEIIVRAAAKKNIKIGQVPICFVDRLLGSSKLGPGEIYQYLKGVFGLLFTELK